MGSYRLLHKLLLLNILAAYQLQQVAYQRFGSLPAAASSKPAASLSDI